MMSNENSASSQGEEMFRPPLNRTMKVLDRSLFPGTIRTVSAVIHEPKTISRIKAELWGDAFFWDRKKSITPLQPALGHETGKKCMLLRPSIKQDDPSTWSRKLAELVDSRQVNLEPWVRELDYDDWNYVDIMTSVLPPDLQDEIPQGFTVVGHIAHFNLRDRFAPYKNLIGQVILDKTPHIRTVINKIEDVGKHDAFRTFSYDLLAGEDTMNVELREQDCVYRFDYSKVYWNSRLDTEHRRLVEKFKPGEAIADAMAGVGPFAIPAAKKQCFVYANDLNPESYESLKDNIIRNKVGQYVDSSNENGYRFIRSATEDIFDTNHLVDVTPVKKVSRHARARSRSGPKERTYLYQPKTFAHYVLNLPDSALTFLPAFVGLHKSRSAYFAANPDIKLPMIHAYCFNTKRDDNLEAEEAICEEISKQIGYEMRRGISGQELRNGEVEVFDVRDVAPSKRMFCASFRLPPKVAFADVPA